MKDARQVALCVLPAAMFACLIAAPMASKAQNYNTAYGAGTLGHNTTGKSNSAFGFDALNNNSTGSSNTSTGYASLLNNTTGLYNTADGAGALENAVSECNTAVGSGSLFYNVSGSFNTGVGEGSLVNNVSGSDNTAVGEDCLQNSSGSYNIGLGNGSGWKLGSGDYNIEIGNDGVGTDSGVIRIGTSGNQNSTYIAGINGVTSSGGVAVYIDSNGQLGTVTSSRRFKNDIKDLGDVSDKLMKLRPVTFRYKTAASDGSHPIQYGLIAEEVAKVSPDLVQYDKEGKPFTVYYNLLTPMLVNEYQKQHRRADAQQTELDALKSDLQLQRSEIDSLKRGHQPYMAPAAIALFGILLIGCVAAGRSRLPNLNSAG